MRRQITFRSAVLATILIAVSGIALADWTQGISAFNAGDYKGAAEHFAEITRTNPTWPGGYYMLGRCQSEMGQETEAIQSLQKALDLDPSDADTVIALSQVLIVEDKFTETRELLENTDAGMIPPALRSQASILLASALLGENSYDAAVTVLQERILADKNNPALFRILGKALAEIGDMEGAFRCYSTAFALDSEESSALAAITTALTLKDDTTNADQKVQWSQKALEIGSVLAASFPNAKYDLMAGEAALGAEDLAAAERWFRAAVLKDQNSPLAWYFLGRTLADLGRDTEAFEAFSTALGFSPYDDLTRRIHGRMGQIAACQLDLKLAAEHYRSALKNEEAEQIDELAAQFSDALAQREKLTATVREIQQMERELAELGDAQGVTAMRERAAAGLNQIAEIERNLEAVRSALCR